MCFWPFFALVFPEKQADTIDRFDFGVKVSLVCLAFDWMPVNIGIKVDRSWQYLAYLLGISLTCSVFDLASCPCVVGAILAVFK